MTLERILEQIKRYALVPEIQTEPLLLEAYVGKCPVRIQIGLPGQSQADLLSDACDAYDNLDATLASAKMLDRPWRRSPDFGACRVFLQNYFDAAGNFLSPAKVRELAANSELQAQVAIVFRFQLGELIYADPASDMAKAYNAAMERIAEIVSGPVMRPGTGPEPLYRRGSVL